MKNLLKLAVAALALSCFQAYGAYVCSSSDAAREADDSWGCQVIETIYDPDKNYYWVTLESAAEDLIMLLSFGFFQKKPPFLDLVLKLQTEEYEQLAEQLRQQIEQD